MVYDSDLNITWLADANYSATQYEQSCGELGAKDGLTTFPEATKWVSELVVNGVSGWRLPRSLQPDPTCERQTVVGSHGYYCSNSESEMGHLFYGDIMHGLSGKAGESIVNIHNANFDLFNNISTYGVYWSSTDFPTLPFITRNFEMRSGFANAYSKSTLNTPWPVHDGDIGLKLSVSPAEKYNQRHCKK